MRNLESTIRDLQSLNDLLKQVEETAVKVGAKPQGLNQSNALKAVLKSAEEWAKVDAEAREMGTTIPNVLKSFRMRNRAIAELPAAFKFAPPHWVTEERTKREDVSRNGKTRSIYTKIKAVSASTAQRQLRGILPLLAELITQAKELEWSERDQKSLENLLEAKMLEFSFEEFSRGVLALLNNMVLAPSTFAELMREEEDDEDLEISEEEELESCLELLGV
jgi:hypothetical protein